ncbi:sugar transferase [Caulobacter vibrioides]|uniref:Sugar transferase n=1 Tax=Caulobacter vibrioides TaxID=155892 RepID=A0A290MRI9_CAUVI|nr:sugar transferase [Caulobacter vibrioides]ATC31515.1 sugar transferase [Caulobacter vibrioides]
MKRAFDLLAAAFGLAVLALPLAVLWLLVRMTSPGPGLYWSQRVGRGSKLFPMPKFRTMRIDTPEVATHLLENPDQWLTPIGGSMRKLSLDELPQLWSVLVGDMSLVGPRPALFNQADLIAARQAAGVDGLRPGVTGWAQINGRDGLAIPDKVALDAEYLRRRSFLFDLRILVSTVVPVLTARGVTR